MRYRTLGRTGIKVGPYALGALALGTPTGNPNPDDSIRILHKALVAGINLIDTFDTYGEVVVGKALEGHRDGVVLASKFRHPTDGDPNHQGASRRQITTAVQNSLRRLQTDYINLYQIHWPDPDPDIGTLDQAYRPPAVQRPEQRRRPTSERAAAVPAGHW